MWSLRVYTRKKRAGQRLNLTPTPELGPTVKAEAPPGPDRRHSAHYSEHTQLRVIGQKSLRGNSTSEEPWDEKIAPLSESMTDDLQVDSSSSSSELVSGQSLQHDISSSLLSYSFTDSYTECKSFEESLSSFPSPELFRGSDYLDWKCPRLEEHMQCKNSTLLDTSKAIAIEKVPQFSDLSAILGPSSEDYQKCHREISDDIKRPKYFSETKEYFAFRIRIMQLVKFYLLRKLTLQHLKKQRKKQPEKDPEHTDKNFQAKLSSRHLKIKVPSSHQRSVTETSAGEPVTNVLLPQSMESASSTNSSTPDKKSRDLLTSTPSSQTAGLVIDLSSVQRASFEELFPNVSTYVNSNEIFPVSSLQENSSNEFPSNKSEICCIIRATPGNRQVKSKGVVVKKKKYSPPKDIPQDIIIKTNGRM
ncbi:meiosis-specific kinetochore protein isoform X3 [Prionailurus iriomotensis]